MRGGRKKRGGSPVRPEPVPRGAKHLVTRPSRATCPEAHPIHRIPGASTGPKRGREVPDTS